MILLVLHCFVTDVAVIGLHDGWQHLHRDEDGMWRGEIETGDQCNSVKLSAKTSDEENMYYQVLQYEVGSTHTRAHTQGIWDRDTIPYSCDISQEIF